MEYRADTPGIGHVVAILLHVCSHLNVKVYFNLNTRIGRHCVPCLFVQR